ncbi:MAG: T9SS type A sorting domain-containing protein, partial [Chitinophagales bacterium]|nr:T9SS type A sorting domain-containing protein [Chitinophagales bacterium]
SMDGVNFEEAGVIDASGFSSETNYYSFIDSNVTELSVGKIFYRLRLVDLDHSFTYSPVRWIELSDINLTNNIQVFPSPFYNELSIQIVSSKDQLVIIDITDISGRLIRESSHQLYKGTNFISFNDLLNLTTGVYFIKANFHSTGIIIKALKQE